MGKDAGGAGDTIGNVIYVVDPADGSAIWRAVGPGGGTTPNSSEQLLFVAGLGHSIPAPVTVVDSDHNGIDDRAYVGDSGGNVWRIELTEHANRKPGTQTTDPANWRVARLASLGGYGDADRRFFHAADVVRSRDLAGEYDGVVIASGNRAAPRETIARNYAYLVKDRTAFTQGTGAVPMLKTDLVQGDLADITGPCLSDTARSCTETDLALGWKLALQAPGEKGLSAPLVSNGRILFTSYVPFASELSDRGQLDIPASCDPSQGRGRVYAVNLKNGSPALSSAGKLKLTAQEELVRYLDIGPGLQGDVMPLQDGILIPGSGLASAALQSVPGRTWWRAYWREEEVDAL